MGGIRSKIEGLLPVTKRYTRRRLDEIEDRIDSIEKSVAAINRKIDLFDDNLTGRIFEQIPDYMKGINYPQREKRIIISLTSYKKRIQFIQPCIYSLLHQSFKPDMVLLWLSEDDFPLGEQELPEELIDLKKLGLSIRWCEDIKCHKKYYETMKHFPEDIIITTDDDVIYHSKFVECLYSEYIKDPSNVYATRVREVCLDQEGNPLPYNTWRVYGGRCERGPAYSLVPTGVGGVLYPPHCMDEEMFDLKEIRELCLYADDLWLKFMQLKAGTKVKKVYVPSSNLILVEGSQENALWLSNVDSNNDDCLKRMNEYFEVKLGQDYKRIIEQIKHELS